MMGGDVTVTSEPGKGSVFTVRLPGGADAAGNGDGIARRPFQPRTDCVLVIDDDATARELISDHLKAEGFSVVTAAGGLEGLKLAKELRPIAITLDVMMPDLDGWSVLAALRQDRELADIPVIMVTIVDEQRRGMALGAVGYLTKPIDRERLHRLVGRFRASARPTRVLLVEDDADPARARALLARAASNGRAGGGERPRGAGASARRQAGRDPARSDDARDGRLCRSLPPCRRRRAGGIFRSSSSPRSISTRRPRAIELRGAIGAGQGDVPAGRAGRAHPPARAQQAGDAATGMEAAS